MKKIYCIFLLSFVTAQMNATSFAILLAPSAYTPNNLTVSPGDVVTITASQNHPLAEVDMTTWNANGTTPMTSGFGIKTSTYTFTVGSTPGTIYYVCQNHVSSGMKGQITISLSTGLIPVSNSVESIFIFPNPAKDLFSVKLNTSENVNVSAKLYSICGQEVETLMVNKEFNLGSSVVTFELQNTMPAGIYFVEFNYNSRKIVKKLIIN